MKIISLNKTSELHSNTLARIASSATIARQWLCRKHLTINCMKKSNWRFLLFSCNINSMTSSSTWRSFFIKNLLFLLISRKKSINSMRVINDVTLLASARINFCSFFPLLTTRQKPSTVENLFRYRVHIIKRMRERKSKGNFQACQLVCEKEHKRIIYAISDYRLTHISNL